VPAASTLLADKTVTAVTVVVGDAGDVAAGLAPHAPRQTVPRTSASRPNGRIRDLKCLMVLQSSCHPFLAWRLQEFIPEAPLMKKLHGLMLAGALLAGAGCDNSPTAPMPASMVFTAQLAAANEAPPVTGADAGATGTVTIAFNNLTYDTAGRVMAGTVDFAMTFNGFPVATTISGAHIHMGAAGTNGAILVDTGLSGRGGITLLTGAGEISSPGISGTGTALQAVIQNPSGTYFNVYTSRSPNGAIRGQLVRQ
jgi:hypothetical protein